MGARLNWRVPYVVSQGPFRLLLSLPHQGNCSGFAREIHVFRGVARGRSWGARDPPLGRPSDNILAIKAIVEKPTFF